ncbi:MAG TPA: NADP-dependent malic enzyme [Firmicutes bacterium]|uniref:NADP-dependent malic enzyme n=1 Tax=Capillibacterium thermochitinicola TaxID=2699427 RepID=A0A8J6HZ96_9FIRM|nr:NADP-dependent malic enzyme [Capillibacterium thermochitinicola]MBA2132805.1 NADP-dependent malic enzyme [Capillibacterium thermochitinicola]HHW12439.1 NADP-dependent malic enzyme [Bacillota bacterium]
MGNDAEALRLHKEKQGKIEIRSKVEINSPADLSLAYSPGVAAPCRAIQQDASLVYTYTNKGNTVAVVTDGTAVLGLGDIGPEAALPVMEGKAILFKRFAGLDAIPLALATTKVEEIVETVVRLAPNFAGINLEDIAAPRCFAIEEALQARLSIPVFHDDQHGTAVVCLAALRNALRVVGKELSQVKIVINGIGAAGSAIARLLYRAGARRLLLCDRQGILAPGMAGLNPYQEALARLTNSRGETGDLATALRGADVFIGVSAANLVSGAMVERMAPQPVIFAMANPDPEISPEKAKQSGAAVVGTGRSDYPNQINNLLGFPGIFRGLLAVRATKVTEEMMLAAAEAIADLVKPAELTADYIIPNPFDRRVVPAVAWAVGSEALKAGMAAAPINHEQLRTSLQEQFGAW